MVSLKHPWRDSSKHPLVIPTGPPWGRQDYFFLPDINTFLKYKNLCSLIYIHLVMFAWKNYTNSTSFRALSWYILIFHQNYVYSSSAATFIKTTCSWATCRQLALKDWNYSWCSSSLFITPRVKITLMLNIQSKYYVTSATKSFTKIWYVLAKKDKRKTLQISITFWHSHQKKCILSPTIKWPEVEKSCPNQYLLEDAWIYTSVQ